MDKERLIEKYLHKELTDQDLKSLNQLLETDQDFKDEFELRTILYADYKTTIKQDLLDSIPPDVQTRHQNRPSIGKFVIAAFITILAALAVYYASSKAKTSTNSSQIIAQYMDEPSRYPTVTKDDTIDPSNPWSIAKQQFIANDYKQFLKTIETIDLSDEQRYYKSLALAYQENPSYQAAIQILSVISDNEDSSFTEEANWFLALFYLKNGQVEEGKTILNQIIKSKAWKQKEAATLLKSLTE